MKVGSTRSGVGLEAAQIHMPPPSRRAASVVPPSRRAADAEGEQVSGD